MSVTLKLATSLDGRIATAAGESRWITGPAAREQVHRLRSAHDAVVIGIETALADDPELTVRLPDNRGRQPARVVLDARLRLPLESRLVRTARQVPTYVVAADGQTGKGLEAAGVIVLPVSTADRGDLTPVIAALAEAGLSDLFVEGGGQVAASFLRARRVDHLEWFRAPLLLGAEGRPAVGPLNIAALDGAPHFRRVEVSLLGEDLWERYARVA